MYSRVLGAILVSSIFFVEAVDADETADPRGAVESIRVKVKLVDENDRPVENAFAGIGAVWCKGEFPVVPLQDGAGWKYIYGAKSNSEGIVEFEAFEDGPKELSHQCIIARNLDRKLVSIWKIDLEKLGKSNAAEILRIRMLPEHRVSGRVTCSDLTSRNRETWWKNRSSLEFPRLKGKVTILDFWGYWCGPCLQKMPELFKLYDKYHGQGLEVIGIHVDTGESEETPVNTVDELDQRLRRVRKDVWDGRDVPYPVALVSGKRTSFGTVVETSDRARGELVAKFGVVSFPTVILIDRQGRIEGRFDPGNSKDVARLEKLLIEN